jgi:hypothetical protein
MADLSTERGAALVGQLQAEVRAARQEDELARHRRQRIEDLLVAVRQEYGDEMSLPELEALIERYYDRSTISRKTAEKIGATRRLATAV